MSLDFAMIAPNADRGSAPLWGVLQPKARASRTPSAGFADAHAKSADVIMPGACAGPAARVPASSLRPCVPGLEADADPQGHGPTLDLAIIIEVQDPACAQ